MSYKGDSWGLTSVRKGSANQMDAMVALRQKRSAPLLSLRGGALRKVGRSVQSADREGLSQGDEEVCECLQRVLLRVDLQAHLAIEIGGREAQGLEDTEGLGLLADEHLE